jgi:hypothetical protein
MRIAVLIEKRLPYYCRMLGRCGFVRRFVIGIPAPNDIEGYGKAVRRIVSERQITNPKVQQG